jgi:dTDP-4-dehydrorhamnose reductase
MPDPRAARSDRPARWLITGASGMLGRDLQEVLASSGGRRVEVAALSHADLDVTDAAAVREAVAGHDVVVNAAAFTRVDDAEVEIEAATAVNATGAGNLAAASAAAGARFVQLSTDYVFDGRAASPYAEGAPLNPLSVYGRTKAEGERLALAAHPSGTLVLRTAWLYGANGANFVTAILGAAAKNETVSVLTDQRGQPTWTMDLARRILEVVETDAPAGIYHATNAGAASRFEFAREIFRLAGLDPERVVPATEVAPRPAPRPAYSVLGHDGWARTALGPLRPWRDALAEAAEAGALAAS